MTYAALSDAEWFAKIAGKSAPPLFELPPESLQAGTVGKAGEAALSDAYMFWQFCRQMLDKHGNGLGPDTNVLDFGVSWGRIIRFWMRDIKPENLHGVDVEERFLTYAKKFVEGPNYTVSNHAPPLSAPGKSLELVYAFSVFSHLPRDLADSWVKEFARVLKPGGIACLTTRPRSHIEQAGGSYAEIFKDRAAAVAAYDAGEFVYFPSGGGGSLTPDKYGEAIIPLAYAEANWSSDLEVIGLIEGYSKSYLQPCFILRKR